MFKKQFYDMQNVQVFKEHGRFSVRFRIILKGSLCDVGLMDDQNRAATALNKQLAINSYSKINFSRNNFFDIDEF